MTDGYVHLLYNNSWKFSQHAAGQLLSGQSVRYKKGRRYGPSITYKITPAGSLSSGQPGGPPCWVSPIIAFGLIAANHAGNSRERERTALIKYVLTGQLGNIVLMLLLPTPLYSSEGNISIILQIGNPGRNNSDQLFNCQLVYLYPDQ
jgi:hypothetical protein